MEEHNNQGFDNTDFENSVDLPQNQQKKEIFSKPVLIGIIVAVVAIVIAVLIVVLLPKKDGNPGQGVDEDASENGESSTETRVKRAVLVAMSQKIFFYNYNRPNDDKIYLRQTLYNSIAAVDEYGLTYKVYGKQKFADVYGTIYTANFSAEVVYDSSTDEYKAIVEVGTLYKE